MFASFTTLQGQDSGFIYGKVTTIDGKSFTGPIRWGKEEVYWTDMFNASKEENNNLDYLSREDKRSLDEHYDNSHNEWGNRWESRLESWFDNNWTHYDKDNRHDHQFACQFGEMKKLTPTGRERAEITLKNGNRIEIDGSGYNDIGTKIKIMDPELGEVDLSWSRIDEIEFMNTPEVIEDKFGEPLYGTVRTYGGSFTGYIQWDHDERISTDKLDGDTDDSDLSIQFGKIESIERNGSRSSYVVLKSGRKMTLRGTNDVNSENKGIIVTSEKFGRIDIPWEEFKMVTFQKPTDAPKSYGSFGAQNELTGVVKTMDGESLKGKLIFDLDESYDFEILQGKSDDIEYILPFRSVSKISPKNYDNSNVTLKNGETIVLGDGQDVSEKNSGILVFTGKDNPTYVSWNRIKEVSFN
jgi:hypothetical protein